MVTLEEHLNEEHLNSTELEQYFARFRRGIIGNDIEFESPFGTKRVLYADWTASGRMYAPIEDILREKIFPLVANTHTETTHTGTMMTKAYHEAKQVIKRHVNANETDVLLFSGSGMTSAVNKLQRILGLRVPERIAEYTRNSDGSPVQATTLRSLMDKTLTINPISRPVVFCTHMEHHSNQTTWIETIADVVLIGQTADGRVDTAHLESLLERYSNRTNKIAAVTGCSNVTGIQTPYHEIARIMHKAGGLCFVDFACSAPYITIDMHPEGDPLASLDAIYFSPHKFLGGPGSSGVLIFASSLYHNRFPDQPGGGTVTYTNPWEQHEYYEDIETREDGGTPPFLQAIKTALCVTLKEEMNSSKILEREHELLSIIFKRLKDIPNLYVLEDHITDRLGVVSFYVPGTHHNLIVKLLNDRYGIQTRGGCSCAGTYGHYLLGVDQERSLQILDELHKGNTIMKPGWVRMSIHPTMTNGEIEYILSAIAETVRNATVWEADYKYSPETNEFTHKDFLVLEDVAVSSWFSLGNKEGAVAH